MTDSNKYKPIGHVDTYTLSEEELLKIRIGAKCDLDKKPRDWKWRSKKGTEARWGYR